MATVQLTPDNLEFVILSFEGPDQPYSVAGGLGVRVAELSQALAQQGFRTHLLFIGDPDLPGWEERLDGRLVLHRWCQWISHYHRAGVYDGEEGKWNDFNDSAPPFVVEHLVRPAVEQGKLVAVLAEEWHTAEATCRISDLLHAWGLRNRALLLWNANNVFSFHRINWGRLSFVATITTVSRYMKHIMWDLGLNPLVIPNGIPARFLLPPDPGAVAALRSRIDAAPLLFKIGRFDPDKRWIMAVEAVARLKERGFPVKFLMRGGIEPHGAEVLGFFVTDELKRLCYGASDAVLANSGHEPFGIVGLEVMGAGGVAVVGATGEDYAVSFQNCLVTETDDPEELVGYLLHVRSNPRLADEIRQEAKRTAALFTWPEVIENLLGKLEYLALRQGVAETVPLPPRAWPGGRDGSGWKGL
jgi:glycosyltransferase involved in cell wall biosynthesis